MQVIIAIAAALISGLAATWYQFRRQRARVYAVPLSYTRELLDELPMVTVPGSVAKRMSLSVYLAVYGTAVAQLSLVREAAQACAELQDLGLLLRDALAEVVTAIERKDDEGQLKAALLSPLQMPLFDKFLMAAARGRVLVSNEELRRQNKQTAALNQKWKEEGEPLADVPMFGPSDDGSYQFGLLGSGVVLGKDLGKWPVAGPQVGPFFQALRFLDPPLLRESLQRLVALLTADLEIVQEALPELNALLAEHFRYVCRLYLANYGAAPALIHAGGTIHVRGANHSPLGIPCQLATVSKSDGIVCTENGLLLGAGADVNIAFVSNTEHCKSPGLQDMLRDAAGKPCEARAEFIYASTARRGTKMIRSRWTQSEFSARLKEL
jgi:hypothetical protein